MSRGGSLLLPGLAITLGLLLAVECLGGRGGAWPLGLGRLPVAREAAAPRPPSVQRWAETVLARPLFNPNRRPPQSSAAVSGVARLTAIIIAGGARSAIFAGAGTGEKPHILLEGDRVDGYAILRITSDTVELGGAAGRLTLHPQFPAAPAAVAAAQPAPPPLPPSAADYDNEN